MESAESFRARDCISLHLSVTGSVPRLRAQKSLKRGTSEALLLCSASHSGRDSKCCTRGAAYVRTVNAARLRVDSHVSSTSHRSWKRAASDQQLRDAQTVGRLRQREADNNSSRSPLYWSRSLRTAAESRDRQRSREDCSQLPCFLLLLSLAAPRPSTNIAIISNRSNTCSNSVSSSLAAIVCAPSQH
jgi:hypothetical protein